MMSLSKQYIILYEFFVFGFIFYYCYLFAVDDIVLSGGNRQNYNANDQDRSSLSSSEEQ